MQVELGYYKHFKGNIYQVVAVGKFTEKFVGHDGLLDVVVYKALYDGEHGYGAVWVRPLAMFMDMVDRGGQKVPRFTRLTDEEAQALIPLPKV